MTKNDMQIRPIRTAADHLAAIARIERLMGARPGTPEGDALDVLATLVDAYEARHHPIDAPDPVTAIEFRMEQEQLSRKDMEPLIGSRARVSEVLTRRRPLTLPMIRRVRDGLGISADLLIGPIRATKTSTSAHVKRSASRRSSPQRTSRNPSRKSS